MSKHAHIQICLCMCAYMETSVYMHIYRCVVEGTPPSIKPAQLCQPVGPPCPSTQPWSKLEKPRQPGGTLTVQGSQPGASQWCIHPSSQVQPGSGWEAERKNKRVFGAPGSLDGGRCAAQATETTVQRETLSEQGLKGAKYLEPPKTSCRRLGVRVLEAA